MAYVKNSIMLGSGGGGTSITVVANYSALPDPTTVTGQFYWAEASQGTAWLPGSLGGTYYNAGMYYSNGVSWTFMNVPYNATLAEVNTGTNNDKFVTPSTLSNSNWAFTSAKVLATVLSGLSASSGTFTSSDTILTAFNKTKYLIDNLSTLILGQVLTGFSASAGTVSASDSILTAFNKIVGNLDLKQNKPDEMVLLSAYVGANSTSLQKMFNVGSGGGGAFNASANKTYEFFWEFDMTGLSSSSGSLSLGLLGTATISSISYKANAAKAASLSAQTGGTITSIQTASATVITATNTATNVKGVVTGTIRASSGGTIIPSYATSVGIGTVQTEPNSRFRIREVGSDTFTHSSNIS